MNVLQYTLDGLAATPGTCRDPVPGRARDVEMRLGTPLPADIHAFAAVFPGGRVHHYEQFPWDPDHPAGVVAITQGLRAAGLRPTDVALGTSWGRLYLWDPSGAGSLPTAPLISTSPFHLKAPLKKHHASRVYHLNYTGLILDQLETRAYEPIRAALDQQHPDLAKRAAKRWRHRWQPHEVEKIDLILRRGIKPGDHLATWDDGEREYIDLRGLVHGPARRSYSHPQPPRPKTPVRVEGVDFSFSEDTFDWIDAHHCRFRAARMSCIHSRFTSCDFSFVDVAGADHRTLRGEFTDCTFSGAYLADCSLDGTFRRCDFAGADLHNSAPEPDAQFIDCTWTHCRFGGDSRHWDPMRLAAFPRL